MWYFAAGDAGFYVAEQLKKLSWLPVLWHPEKGFGQSSLARLWFDYPYDVVIKALSSVGFSWWFIDKLLWISVLVLAIFSSYKLASYVLRNSKIAGMLASIIYSTNTYILLLFGGGQIGVALAYAFAPFVLLKYIEYVDKPTFKKSILNGVWLAMLIGFDLRLAYLILLVAGLYFLLFGRLTMAVRTFIIPGILAVLLHAFWIVPAMLTGGVTSSLGEQFTNPGMLNFLSVADFSHAVSLLHPNWPENLFGKVYFMQPEFVVLALLAFASLLFKKRKTIYFFVLLSLAGAFLAKGVQEPFGGVFQWMFTHIPGFILLRDPTKFYLFIAIGYSVLIPYTLSNVAKKIRLHELIIFSVFVIFWCFTVRPVFLGEMRGNFQPPRLPAEYVQLKNLLMADKTPSRTLWIPEEDAFAYMSDIHPILTSNELLDNASVSAVAQIVQTPEFLDRISESGVKYVIVPIDLEKRLFLTDYRFNPLERDLLVDALEQTNLIKDPKYSDVAVFINNQFIMHQETPVAVIRQQRLAMIGLSISASCFIGILGLLVMVKNKK